MPSNNGQTCHPATQCDIPYKTNPSSRSLRAVIITANEKKFQEFRSQLGDRYGMDVQKYSPDRPTHVYSDQDIIHLCEEIMEKSEFSPHFILCEQTSLLSISHQEDLTELSLEALANRSLERVLHVSCLRVYKPQWTESLEKKLTGFTQRHFEKSIKGYIKPHANAHACEHGFGWDNIVVHATTNLTNEELSTKYGKTSARQQAASDFIESYLRYKTLVSLTHHAIPLKRPVDFGRDYFHLTTFVKEERYLSNPHIHQWGIQKLRDAMINDGLFFKAAWSRPVKNYFSPPFSGLPLTAKKDDAEETIFMTHDILHHLIPDLVCDTNAAKEYFNIYSAWRMTSEACTLVLADMLYADGLIQSGVERTCVDKRIYPLFEVIKITQRLPSPEEMTNEDKIALLRKLLFANVRYALLGDDSEWQALLTQERGQILPEHLAKLSAYKNHFEKFFIGDHAWTRANFENMSKHAETLHAWVDRSGKETFRKSNIPLLSDTHHQLKLQQVSIHQYDEVVNAVFNLIFETRIKPHLQQEIIEFEPNDIVQSRAFRRFLIGQASLFARYPVPLHLDSIPDFIFSRLQSDTPFSNEEQEHIRQMLEQYILGIEGLGLMSVDEALNAIDCATVFPAVYITYPAMKKKYGSIASCVAECVQRYASEKEMSADSPFTRVIQGITFIDAIALERSIAKEIPAHDRLRQKMIRAGVQFWDGEQTIIKKPVVGISAIGGFSVCLEGDVPVGMIKFRMGEITIGPMSTETLADGLKETMGMQSTHTYMNPNGKRPRELYDVTVKHAHFSIAHAAQMGIHIFGLSKKAELELDVQRDKLHLARQTSARNASQDEPCLFAMSAAGASMAKQIRDSTIHALHSFPKSGNALDWREERNAIYPLSAVVSLGLNGSLRNFQSVMADIGSDGKEIEYRNVLALINDSLSALFPELFKSTPAYSHVYPAHWTNKTTPPSSLTQSGLSFYSTIAKNTKTAILLLGAPCVGKSTQLARIMAQLPSFMCVSTGHLVRKLETKINLAEPLTDIERNAAESLDKMKRGELMDDDAVYALLMAHLSPGGEGHEAYLRADVIILDGIIKAQQNIQPFEHALQTFNVRNPVKLSLDRVINLHAPEEVLITRCMTRMNDAIQNGQAPRPDDTPEIYRKRLLNYMAENTKILDYYSDILPVFEVNGAEDSMNTTRELLDMMKSRKVATSPLQTRLTTEP